MGVPGDNDWGRVSLAQAGKGVNINRRILAEYLEELLPGIAAEGDDANYGSAAMHDVLLLQARGEQPHP